MNIICSSDYGQLQKRRGATGHKTRVRRCNRSFLALLESRRLNLAVRSCFARRQRERVLIKIGRELHIRSTTRVEINSHPVFALQVRKVEDARATGSENRLAQQFRQSSERCVWSSTQQ
ncbi:hypothetical protein PUN28_014750 [Cardiocondyla obscurior]|uniref:Ribosomal protein L20 n=1 Tax=Cardiocondyla obscurior TaxID=286306 RepID=A0AAW2EZ13_9HYME